MYESFVSRPASQTAEEACPAPALASAAAAQDRLTTFHAKTDIISYKNKTRVSRPQTSEHLEIKSMTHSQTGKRGKGVNVNLPWLQL